MASPSFRRGFGLVREQEIEGVLDASGFAYSDQWGAGPSRWLARSTRRWKAQGKKIVLLPQAFGPFAGRSTRSAIRQSLRRVDLVFARDKASYEALLELADERGCIKRAPDFTNLVSSEPHHRGLPADVACVVPNMRMVDKTDPPKRDQYLQFLAQCIDELTRRGLEPVVVLFDVNADEALVPLLEAKVGRSLRHVCDRHVIGSKEYLGGSKVIVGSRYHALICGLCQGVPCLGTGWSHKYRALFEDYGCPEMLCDTNASAQQVHETLGRTLHEPDRSRLIARLKLAADAQRAESNEMWNDVDRLLGLK